MPASRQVTAALAEVHGHAAHQGESLQRLPEQQPQVSETHGKGRHRWVPVGLAPGFTAQKNPPNGWVSFGSAFQSAKQGVYTTQNRRRAHLLALLSVPTMGSPFEKASRQNWAPNGSCVGAPESWSLKGGHEEISRVHPVKVCACNCVRVSPCVSVSVSMFVSVFVSRVCVRVRVLRDLFAGWFKGTPLQWKAAMFEGATARTRTTVSTSCRNRFANSQLPPTRFQAHPLLFSAVPLPGILTGPALFGVGLQGN